MRLTPVIIVHICLGLLSYMLVCVLFLLFSNVLYYCYRLFALTCFSYLFGIVAPCASIVVIVMFRYVYVASRVSFSNGVFICVCFSVALYLSYLYSC